MDFKWFSELSLLSCHTSVAAILWSLFEVSHLPASHAKCKGGHTWALCQWSWQYTILLYSRYIYSSYFEPRFPFIQDPLTFKGDRTPRPKAHCTDVILNNAIVSPGWGSLLYDIMAFYGMRLQYNMHDVMLTWRFFLVLMHIGHL